MKDYRNLFVWKISHVLVLRIYALTASFPKSELFGLSGQIRRAAASVPANIAEGCGRYGDAELKRFINIALGSACELDYHALLATDLGYWSPEEGQSLAADIMSIRRMLGSLIKRLK